MKQNLKAEVAPAECGQHTPTPWESAESWPFPDDAGRRFAAVIKRFQRSGYKDEALICSFEHSVFRDSAGANAAFIVRAANAHDQLVSALQACEAYISLLARHTGDRNDTWATGTIAGDAQAKARAALAQAQKSA